MAIEYVSPQTYGDNFSFLPREAGRLAPTKPTESKSILVLSFIIPLSGNIKWVWIQLVYLEDVLSLNTWRRDGSEARREDKMADLLRSLLAKEGFIIVISP